MNFPKNLLKCVFDSGDLERGGDTASLTNFKVMPVWLGDNLEFEQCRPTECVSCLLAIPGQNLNSVPRISHKFICLLLPSQCQSQARWRRAFREEIWAEAWAHHAARWGFMKDLSVIHGCYGWPHRTPAASGYSSLRDKGNGNVSTHPTWKSTEYCGNPSMIFGLQDTSESSKKLPWYFKNYLEVLAILIT